MTRHLLTTFCLVALVDPDHVLARLPCPQRSYPISKLTVHVIPR
jgi:hypothetical protein